MTEIIRVLIPYVFISAFLMGCGDQPTSDTPGKECKEQDLAQCQQENGSSSSFWDMGKPTDRSKNEGF